MKRRRQSTDSSLDLFLDTICNAFGGIMFLSILVSVLAQMKSKATERNETGTTTVSVEDAEQIQQDIDTLIERRNRLARLLKESMKPKPTSNQPEVEAACAEAKRLQGEGDKAMQTQATMAGELAKILEDNASLSKQIHELDGKLAGARAALQKKTADLDQSLNEHEQSMRSPKVRESDKGNFMLLMRYGKVYVVFSDQATNSYFDAHVQVTTSGPTGKDAIAPKPSAGWSVARQEDKAEFLAYLAKHSSNLELAAIIVWPDSFDEFGDLKALFVAEGYEYELSPVDDIPWIGLKPKDSNAKAQ